MSKKTYTIRSSNKKEFDKKLNFFLELGFKSLDETYEIDKQKDKTVYSQSISFDLNKYEVEFYDNGQIKHLHPNTKIKKTGYYMGMTYPFPHQANERVGYYLWYENGQMESESTYVERNRDGKRTKWYKNGQKKQEQIYKSKDLKQDLIKTKITSWYENGQKKAKGNIYIIQGFEAMNGKWTEWYENGQKKQEGNIKNSYRVGKWTFWHESGQKKEEGTYKLINNSFDLISRKCWDERGNKKECDESRPE